MSERFELIISWFSFRHSVAIKSNFLLESHEWRREAFFFIIVYVICGWNHQRKPEPFVAISTKSLIKIFISRSSRDSNRDGEKAKLLQMYSDLIRDCVKAHQLFNGASICFPSQHTRTSDFSAILSFFFENDFFFFFFFASCWQICFVLSEKILNLELKLEWLEDQIFWQFVISDKFNVSTLDINSSLTFDV